MKPYLKKTKAKTRHIKTSKACSNDIFPVSILQISKRFFLSSPCPGFYELKRSLACTVAIDRHCSSWLLDQWAPCHMALWCWPLIRFSPVKLDALFLPIPLFSLLPPVFPPISGIWGRRRKLGYKYFPIFSVLHPKFWLLTNSKAKVLTPLFSGYILTTFLKALGDSCLASQLGLGESLR